MAMEKGGRERLRLLVMGDSGVGKTSLMHLICEGEELRRPRSTVGCTVHMKLHESKLLPGKTAFVEFWDLGGSARFQTSRQVFYSNAVDGVILVHDVTNSISRRNLEKWKQEWTQHASGAGGAGSWDRTWGDDVMGSPDFKRSTIQRAPSLFVPTLTIGNKIDLQGSKQMMSEEMEAGDYQEISTCANRSSGTQDYESLVLRIDSFIDKVLEAKVQSGYASKGSSMVNSVNSPMSLEYRKSTFDKDK
ncbi:hypothetical protein GUITHDRAFT_175451 [Guillardia theta CCMP2712]|uniref:Uncharacterized protein n=1 Tax=Guillardia theta (strain CCMP2712) TaxID=905079 RepID=L1I819_GUITC|nr:hypothetical protein GUITHDRAFT_175451 [Guillardia theta CCMP2712]EKX32227.1 hypothetical protein GUITHDRAFT_175451 [Guillardia theta CCMP2712]|eukprot:XP_005819207.1 hypothetical protein GUITHDRAFT_175451 [Guillardia theta CCMP2712]